MIIANGAIEYDAYITAENTTEWQTVKIQCPEFTGGANTTQIRIGIQRANGETKEYG